MTEKKRLSLKERQRLEREALILQAADEILEEKSYYDTSMEEIAARVGISKATIYAHFDSKEDLAIAIFVRDMQTFLLGVEDVIATKETAQAKLDAVLHFFLTHLFQKRVYLLSNVYNNLMVRNHEFQPHSEVSKLWKQLVDLIHSLLEEGLANGEFESFLSADVMLYAFFGLLISRRVARNLKREATLPPDFADQLSHIFFQGITPQKDNA